MLVKKFVIKKKCRKSQNISSCFELISCRCTILYHVWVFFLIKHSTCIQLAMSDGMDLNVKISVDIALQMTVAITSMVAVSLGVIEVTLETFAALVSWFFICP